MINLMNTKTLILALVASSFLASPVLAQDAAKMTNDKATVETSGKPARAPHDLAKFSRMDELKAADKNNDGILSREEIEAHALKTVVKRTADRMERRLDVNKDGKISLDAIEKHRAEKFAKLDKNKDGKLDRSEMKAGKHHGKNGHGKGGHGKDGHNKGDHGKGGHGKDGHGDHKKHND